MMLFPLGKVLKPITWYYSFKGSDRVELLSYVELAKQVKKEIKRFLEEKLKLT
jgi:hypothetical protein